MIFKNSCADCEVIKRSPPLSIRNGQRLKWPSKFAVYGRVKAGVKKTWPKRWAVANRRYRRSTAGYKRHSLPLLRRIAQVLDADVVVALVPRKAAQSNFAETKNRRDATPRPIPGTKSLSTPHMRGGDCGCTPQNRPRTRKRFHGPKLLQRFLGQHNVLLTPGLA
jgi:hypothetical protein